MSIVVVAFNISPPLLAACTIYRFGRHLAVVVSACLVVVQFKDGEGIARVAGALGVYSLAESQEYVEYHSKGMRVDRVVGTVSTSPRVWGVRERIGLEILTVR